MTDVAADDLAELEGFASLVLSSPPMTDAESHLASGVLELVEALRASRRADPSQWMLWALTAAEATGKVFMIGVRPHGRGWFSHCNDVEQDGEPEWSVPAVVEEVRKKAERDRRQLESDASVAGSVVARLPDVTFPPVEE